MTDEKENNQELHEHEWTPAEQALIDIMPPKVLDAFRQSLNELEASGIWSDDKQADPAQRITPIAGMFAMYQASFAIWTLNGWISGEIQEHLDRMNQAFTAIIESSRLEREHICEDCAEEKKGAVSNYVH